MILSPPRCVSITLPNGQRIGRRSFYLIRLCCFFQWCIDALSIHFKPYRWGGPWLSLQQWLFEFWICCPGENVADKSQSGILVRVSPIRKWPEVLEIGLLGSDEGRVSGQKSRGSPGLLTTHQVSLAKVFTRRQLAEFHQQFVPYEINKT